MDIEAITEKFDHSVSQYIRDLVRYLNGLEKGARLLAYHFPCADGAASAALALASVPAVHDPANKEETLVPVPLSYDVLKEPELREWLQGFEWDAVVDLEPFPMNRMRTYVDHHGSVVNLEMNADVVVYVADHPSAASLIASHQPFGKLGEIHMQLAEISEITDTASFQIDPPMDVSHHIDESNQQEIAWLLNDAAFQSNSIKSSHRLVNALRDDGIAGLLRPEILEKAAILRTKRKKAVEAARRLEIKPMMILISKDSDFDLKSAIYYLMQNGAMVAVSVRVMPEIVKLSLRITKRATEAEVEKYRVDLLARTMSGGGHKPASGAATSTLDEALDKLQEWAASKSLELSISNMT